MTERGMAYSDGAPACPFVAFEDDRDERSDRPDHRHRCYAEVHPAPRAIAHQEAYCLSSAFAVCPTFQDWAQREAARTRGGAAATNVPRATVAVSGEAIDHHHEPEEAMSGGSGERPAEPAAEWLGPRPAAQDDTPAPLPPRRNPPRDWAAPPPWASGPGGSGAAGGAAGAAGAGAAAGAAGAAGSESAGTGGATPETPRFLADREARGLAGSPADRVAAGDSFVPPPGEVPPAAPRSDPWVPSRSPERAQPADEELAGLVGSTARDRAQTPAQGYETVGDDTNRYRYETAGRPPSGGPQRDLREGPSWEQPKRYEAYPTIKARPSMPGLPRLGIMAAALGIAALALFFLPALLGWFGDNTGGGGTGGASPTPSSPIESVVPSPTTPPAPTPQVYVVKSGDTMSKIADRFNVSLDDLLEANKDTIKDPDLIAIGDRVIIPVPADDFGEPAASGAP
jgi:nucleoid-associated protein YgaU